MNKFILVAIIISLLLVPGIWYNFIRDNPISAQETPEGEGVTERERMFTPEEVVVCILEVPIGEAIEEAMAFSCQLSKALASLQWAVHEYPRVVREIADLASQCDSRFCLPSCEFTALPAATIRVVNMFGGKVIVAYDMPFNIVKPLALNNPSDTPSQFSCFVSNQSDTNHAYSTSGVISGSYYQLASPGLSDYALSARPGDLFGKDQCKAITFEWDPIGESLRFLLVRKDLEPELPNKFDWQTKIEGETLTNWFGTAENTTYKAAIFNLNTGERESDVVTVSTEPCPPVGPPEITITAPTAGESLKVGSDYTIRWTSVNLPGGTIEILLQAEGAPDPNAWEVIADNLPIAQTSYPWTVPDYTDKCEARPCWGDPCWQRDEIETKYQQLASLSRTIAREKETIDILLNESRPKIREKLDEARRSFEKNAPTVELYELLRGPTPCVIAINNYWVELQDVQDEKVCKSLYNYLICR